jgi:UDP-N-acetylmuramate--alanine ligase
VKAGIGSVLGRTRRIHFVGVGGAGMSGIAEVLANLGYTVTGSDEKRSAVTARLTEHGVAVFEGHAAAQVGDADVVVVSSAVRASNPEVVEARRRHIPVIPRAEMLAELMRLRYSVAVAGAHGKTTTTSMIAVTLERAGLDPTAVIGGRLSAFGGHARLGRSELLVAEADESDRSFLKLFPTLAVMTNVDREHLESYGTLADVQQAFVEFANKVPFYGAVVACADDPGLQPVLPRVERRLITYGVSETADVRATEIVLEPFGARCRVSRRTRTADREEALGALTLAVPGHHNILNALAAVTVGLELEVPFARIADGLAAFRGVERRFERRGEAAGVLLVDDYGHHPAEIAAVLAAAAALRRRTIVVFQPHRYSRTAQLMHEFGPALAAADEIVLTDIYAAGEDPIPGVTIEALDAAVRQAIDVPTVLVKSLADVPAAVAARVRPGDLVITLGAGSIAGVADRILEVLR